MANIIAGYRRMTGLSQTQMANKLGIGVVTYRAKENGKSEFKMSEMFKFYEIVKEANDSVTYEDIFLNPNRHV